MLIDEKIDWFARLENLTKGILEAFILQAQILNIQISFFILTVFE